jgi:hypothetical protein
MGSPNDRRRSKVGLTRRCCMDPVLVAGERIATPIGKAITP